MAEIEPELKEKYKKLLDIIKKERSAAVAFSGGVDSSLLCHCAVAALGSGNCAAITVVSPMLAASELADAKKVAELTGIRHILIYEDEIDAVVAENSRERCYFCKKIEFGNIIAEAEKLSFNAVFDGSNLDDLSDYRPGLQAVSELKVISPLRLAALRKADIRSLARHFSLPVWDKPAFACLASRIPYGEKIEREKLRRIEKAEDFLRGRGFKQFRVRSHDNIARIEVAPSERGLFFSEAFLDECSAALKALGWSFVAFEAAGYKMGSLNST